MSMRSQDYSIETVAVPALIVGGFYVAAWHLLWGGLGYLQVYGDASRAGYGDEFFTSRWFLRWMIPALIAAVVLGGMSLRRLAYLDSFMRKRVLLWGIAGMLVAGLPMSLLFGLAYAAGL